MAKESVISMSIDCDENRALFFGYRAASNFLIVCKTVFFLVVENLCEILDLLPLLFTRVFAKKIHFPDE